MRWLNGRLSTLYSTRHYLTLTCAAVLSLSELFHSPFTFSWAIRCQFVTELSAMPDSDHILPPTSGLTALVQVLSPAELHHGMSTLLSAQNSAGIHPANDHTVAQGYDRCGSHGAFLSVFFVNYTDPLQFSLNRSNEALGMPVPGRNFSDASR